MSFLFASSHLPETRVRRPEPSGAERDRLPQAARRANAVSQHEEEEEEDNVQPMRHSGGVRAFSHLPVKREAGPLSLRGAQTIGRQFQRTEHENPGRPDEDGISAAKASGLFDVVRQQYNRGDTPHFMDEDGNLRPRDETRQQDSPPPPRAPRSPQAGASTPTGPTWSASHAADGDSSRSPRASSSASDDTNPCYLPPIPPEDLAPQHSDDADSVTGSHFTTKGRPEARDLVIAPLAHPRPSPGFKISYTATTAALKRLKKTAETATRIWLANRKILRGSHRPTRQKITSILCKYGQA